MIGFLCSLPGAAALIAACAVPPPFATGYVEGEYALVAPVEVAQIDEIMVDRGTRVKPGQPLARMESQDAEIALAQADAALAQARSRLADLREGGIRPGPLGPPKGLDVGLGVGDVVGGAVQADQAQ